MGRSGEGIDSIERRHKSGKERGKEIRGNIKGSKGEENRVKRKQG